MGPYVGLNAVLVGLFGFAAIYHVVLWWQSRRDTVLIIFAVHCALCALISADLLALVTRKPSERANEPSTGAQISQL